MSMMPAVRKPYCDGRRAGDQRHLGGVLCRRALVNSDKPSGSCYAAKSVLQVAVIAAHVDLTEASCTTPARAQHLISRAPARRANGGDGAGGKVVGRGAEAGGWIASRLSSNRLAVTVIESGLCAVVSSGRRVRSARLAAYRPAGPKLQTGSRGENDCQPRQFSPHRLPFHFRKNVTV